MLFLKRFLMWMTPDLPSMLDSRLHVQRYWYSLSVDGKARAASESEVVALSGMSAKKLSGLQCPVTSIINGKLTRIKRYPYYLVPVYTGI